MWQQLVETGYWQGEIINRRKDGQQYNEMLSVSTIYDNDGAPVNFVGIFSDVTSYKEKEQALEKITYYDTLTGLPNRALLTDRFEQAKLRSQATNKKFALCILDLDDFKRINQIYDKAQGDQLLIDVADRIENQLNVDDTVSRQGGDQFFLLISNIEQMQQAESQLETILKAVREPFCYKQHEISMTASIGITVFPDDNVDLDAMLRHADHALYLAKVAGKNRWKKFNTDSDKETVLKQNFLQEIRNALVKDEFKLFDRCSNDPFTDSNI